MTGRRIAAGVGVGLGLLRLRAGVQPATLAQPGNLRLAEIPELAAPLRFDLPVCRELAQSLATDLQLVCGDGQGYQAVLRHARDSSAYANSLPRRCLRVHQITGKIVGVIQSNREDSAVNRRDMPPAGFRVHTISLRTP
jgi:hypothetical protein